MSGGLEQIVSDDEIIRVHANAKFGSMSPREVVNDGVRKTAVGYHCGRTQVCILREHGLITKPRYGRHDVCLTQKGKKYGRALWHVDEATARAKTEPSGDTAGLVERIHEEIDEGSGFWKACSGCQEGVDGYVSERDYPYSKTLRCQPGGGCSECGGLGVLWDNIDYGEMADAMLADMEAEETANDRATAAEARAVRAEQIVNIFRNADPSDFDYVIGLLTRSIRHNEDAQTRFWLAAMIELSRARTALSANAREGSDA